MELHKKQKKVITTAPNIIDHEICVPSTSKQNEALGLMDKVMDKNNIRPWQEKIACLASWEIQA